MRQVLYLGRRIEGGRPYRMFRDLGTGDTFYYPKAKSAFYVGLVIGHIYDIPDEGGPESWTDARVDQVAEEERLRYQVKDRAAQQWHAAKNNSVAPDLEEVIDQLRSARSAMVPARQSAFDGWLLYQIRGHHS